MAVITLYKYKVDTEAYEDSGATVSESVHTRYRNPLYTANLYPVTCLVARYGADYVDVWKLEVDGEWECVS